MVKMILFSIVFLAFPVSESNRISTNNEYAILKKKIASRKSILKTKYILATTASEKKQVLDESRNILTKIILDEIIPHWYKTKWSFEGHTEIPKSGEIACGYFVSTTLNHSGVNVNRYKLAQKSPEDEANTLQISGEIEKIENTNPSAFKSFFLKNKKDGLYFVGLDFHVGYLLKENNEIYFIHSNYINSEGVVKENITQSAAFLSKKYFIVPITHNDALVKKWILNEVLKTT